MIFKSNLKPSISICLEICWGKSTQKRKKYSGRKKLSIYFYTEIFHFEKMLNWRVFYWMLKRQRSCRGWNSNGIQEVSNSNLRLLTWALTKQVTKRLKKIKLNSLRDSQSVTNTISPKKVLPQNNKKTNTQKT